MLLPIHPPSPANRFSLSPRSQHLALHALPALQQSRLLAHARQARRTVHHPDRLLPRLGVLGGRCVPPRTGCGTEEGPEGLCKCVSLTSTLISCRLSAFLRTRIADLSRTLFTVACATFQNSNSLPIALLQSLIGEKLPLAWGPHDTRDGMLGRGLTYLGELVPAFSSSCDPSLFVGVNSLGACAEQD